jgi:hypothetical protein
MNFTDGEMGNLPQAADIFGIEIMYTSNRSPHLSLLNNKQGKTKCELVTTMVAGRQLRRRTGSWDPWWIFSSRAHFI